MGFEGNACLISKKGYRAVAWVFLLCFFFLRGGCLGVGALEPVQPCCCGSRMKSSESTEKGRELGSQLILYCP